MLDLLNDFLHQLIRSYDFLLQSIDMESTLVNFQFVTDNQKEDLVTVIRHTILQNKGDYWR